MHTGLTTTIFLRKYFFIHFIHLSKAMYKAISVPNNSMVISLVIYYCTYNENRTRQRNMDKELASNSSVIFKASSNMEMEMNIANYNS